MISERTVFEIHRLHNEGQSIRKIAARLSLSRDSVAKYLHDPVRRKITFQRPSKLDPYREEVKRLLDIDPEASSEVIRQRLIPLGFDGGNTIVRDYLRTIRSALRNPRAFIRFESAPGEQVQIDWGHFGSLPYGNTVSPMRRLSTEYTLWRTRAVLEGPTLTFSLLHASSLLAGKGFNASNSSLNLSRLPALSWAKSLFTNAAYSSRLA